MTAANARMWDAAVVGAGPAGAIAARELARRGAAVVLIEKQAFPRYKVCGCCLNVRALDALARVGLADLPAAHGAQALRRMQLHARGGHAIIALPGGVALSRSRLDQALADEAVAAGATFLPETRAELAGKDPEYRELRLNAPNGPATIRARLVLAAGGLGSRLLRSDGAFTCEPIPGARIGAGATGPAPPGIEPHTIHMAVGTHGYVGWVRVENGQLDVAAALDPEAVKTAGGLGTAVAQVLAEAGVEPIPGLSDWPWRGTPALTRSATALTGHRVLVLGDAAGYVEPFTGEGMAWALTSGLAAATLGQRAIAAYDASIEREWTHIYSEIVTRRQGICRAVAWTLRRPRMTRALAAVLARAPVLAAPFVRALNNPPGKVFTS